MKKHLFDEPDPQAHSNLRDAYKVSGFRVRSRIESYVELKHQAFVLTLDRRSKKRYAAAATSVAEVCTTNVGDARAIWDAAIAMCILILSCAVSVAKGAA